MMEVRNWRVGETTRDLWPDRPGPFLAVVLNSRGVPYLLTARDLVTLAACFYQAADAPFEGWKA